MPLFYWKLVGSPNSELFPFCVKFKLTTLDVVIVPFQPSSGLWRSRSGLVQILMLFSSYAHCVWYEKLDSNFFKCISSWNGKISQVLQIRNKLLLKIYLKKNEIMDLFSWEFFFVCVCEHTCNCWCCATSLIFTLPLLSWSSSSSSSQLSSSSSKSSKSSSSSSLEQRKNIRLRNAMLDLKIGIELDLWQSGAFIVMGVFENGHSSHSNSMLNSSTPLNLHFVLGSFKVVCLYLLL